MTDDMYKNIGNWATGDDAQRDNDVVKVDEAISLLSGELRLIQKEVIPPLIERGVSIAANGVDLIEGQLLYASKLLKDGSITPLKAAQDTLEVVKKTIDKIPTEDLKKLQEKYAGLSGVYPGLETHKQTFEDIISDLKSRQKPQIAFDRLSGC